MSCSESEFIKEYNDIEEKIISEEFNRVKSNVFEFILYFCCGCFFLFNVQNNICVERSVVCCVHLFELNCHCPKFVIQCFFFNQTVSRTYLQFVA